MDEKGTSSRRRQVVTVGAAVVLLVALAGIWWALNKSELAAGWKVLVLPDGATEARLIESDDGELVYHIKWDTGLTENLTPVEFAQELEQSFNERPLYMQLLNVTSVAGIFWVGVGLLAQIVFMARMLVQWVASEKEKRSVVPPMFWWLSLAGASMLIVYFVWRRDAIGVLGQATGWVVYIRNIMLLARDSGPPAADPLDEQPARDAV